MNKQPVYRAFSTLRNPAAWLSEFFGGTESKTGVRVTTNSALGLAPVIYAVNKISGHVSQLPINVYSLNDDGTKDYKTSNPAYQLLNHRSNQYMMASTVREVVMVHALVNGNGRAYIERNEMGTPVGLIPIAPHECQTILVDNKKYHLVSNVAGSPQSIIPENLLDGEYFKVSDRNMLHLMNTSHNGIWGMHLLELAKDVFGLTQSTQDTTATTMANSGRPGVVLEAPKGTFRNPKDAEKFLDDFNKRHEGINNAGRVGMLREGMTISTVPVNAQDLALLQQRGFQREEVAMLFGLESIMGDNTGQTYRSISERNTAYINNCLQRWFVKWENEITSKLINPTRKLAVEFDSTPLAKGDPNSLADYTTKMVQSGQMTPNEARSLHGLAPVEDGNQLVKQGTQKEGDGPDGGDDEVRE